MSDMMPYLLGAVLAAFLMFPAGYVARVVLSREAHVPPPTALPPPVLSAISAAAEDREDLRKTLAMQQTQILDLAHGVQLMKQEWVDFYEKTRKSEERNRKRMKAAGERDEDNEDLSDTDQLLMQVMQQQAEQGAPANEDVYARADRLRPRGQ